MREGRVTGDTGARLLSCRTSQQTSLTQLESHSYSGNVDDESIQRVARRSLRMPDRWVRDRVCDELRERGCEQTEVRDGADRAASGGNDRHQKVGLPFHHAV